MGVVIQTETCYAVMCALGPPLSVSTQFISWVDCLAPLIYNYKWSPVNLKFKDFPKYFFVWEGTNNFSASLYVNDMNLMAANDDSRNIKWTVLG